MTEANALEIIRRIFCEVMEKQVFMIPEPRAAADIPCGELAFLGGRMTFQGEFQGSLMLAMPEGMAREIAANFLGVDADDPSAATAGGDALKEMLNIACGNMLTALCGTKPVFDLSMPEVAPLDCEHLAALAGSPDALVFEVEGYPVVLHAELGRGVWILAEGER